MKKTILILLNIIVTISILLGLNFSVNAANSDYNIDNAEFDVFINTDNGDVIIKEKWDVNFINGEFTRFYKDICRPNNQLEYFRNFTLLECTVNNIECEKSNSLDRVNYHYFIDKSDFDSSITFNWFYHVQGEKVHYEISYKLSDCIKLDENDMAVFCYRLIGNNFSKQVDNVKVNVNFPDIDIYDITVSDGDYTIEANKIIFEADKVDSIYKIRLNMDSSYFSNLSRVKDVELPKTSLNPIDIIEVLAVFSIPLLIFGSFCYGIFFVIRTIIERIYIKNSKPNIFIDSAKLLDDLHVPLPWLVLYPKKFKCPYNDLLIVYLQLFDMCLRNKAYINEDGFGISNQMNIFGSDFDNLDVEYLEILRNSIKCVDFNGYYFFEFSTFEWILLDKTARAKFTSDINKWKNKYKKQFPEFQLYKTYKTFDHIKQIKKYVNLWKRNAAAMVNKVSLFECMSAIQRTGTINMYAVLSLIFAYDLITSNKRSYNETMYMYTFCANIDNDYALKIASSNNSGSGSGCSSCSSCSSCGGCGGGGAD